MASPITWQTIRGPSVAEAAAPLASAANTISKGLGGLVDVHKDYMTQEKDTNTAAFLDAMSQYRSPQEYQAALESGQIDALRSQFGKYIDADKARTAMDTRGALLMEQNLAQDAFDQSLQTRAARPILEAYQERYLSGDVAGADAIAAANPNINFVAAMKDRNQFVNDQATREQAEKLGKVQLANATQSGQLTELQLKKAQTEATEDTLYENLSDTLHQQAQSHKQQVDAAYLALGPLAAGLGIPLTASGIPILAEATPEQRKNLSIAARSQGYELPSGDTQAAEQALLALGEVPAKVATKLKEFAKTAYDTTPQLIGTDAAAVEKTLAAAAKAEEAYGQDNIFAVHPSNRYNPDQTIAEFASKRFPDDPGEVQEIDTAANRLMTKEFTDYSDQRRKPTKVEIMVAVGLLENSNWGLGVGMNPSRQLEDKVKEVMKNADINRQYLEFQQRSPNYDIDRRTTRYNDARRVRGE